MNSLKSVCRYAKRAPMTFDQLKQQVETFLGCQIGVELREPSASDVLVCSKPEFCSGVWLASKSQRCISEIWRYGAASRARSAVSPDAITAVSNSSAVATTNASIALAEDMRALVRRAPARCEISRVRSATTIAPRFRTTFTAASNREPR